MIALLTLYLVSLAIVAVLVIRAPEGHEIDGVGFRYGPQRFDDAGCEPTNRLTSPRSLRLHASLSTQAEGRNHG